MEPEERELITDLKKCNFEQMRKYLNNIKPDINREQKEASKKYCHCTIYGKSEKLVNFKISGGLFIGRGLHPKRGMIKKRVLQEDVTINCSEDCIPPGTWKEIIHDSTVNWLAKWKNSVTNTTVYMNLHPTYVIRIANEKKKFEKAKSLDEKIDEIREDYREYYKSEDIQTRQIGIALYLIDEFLIRAGYEKGENKADTYGCCSLLVKHVKLHADNYVELDFTGKHSMPFNKKREVDPIVYKNLELLKLDKDRDLKKVFDQIVPAKLNIYLKSKMDGLTTKIFKTYNACTRFEIYLKKLTTQTKKSYYTALEKIAEECNHQRAGKKGTTANIKDKIKNIKQNINDCKSNNEVRIFFLPDLIQ